MGQSTTVIPTGGGGAKVQDSIPTNPQKGDLWVDTSLSPPATKWYDGTDFIRISPTNTQDTSVDIVAEEIFRSNTINISNNTETFNFNLNSPKAPLGWSVNNSFVDVIEATPSGSGNWDVTLEFTGGGSRDVNVTAYSAVDFITHNHSL